MAKTKVVVDPITRIEGHLRIEAQSEPGRGTRIVFSLRLAAPEAPAGAGGDHGS